MGLLNYDWTMKEFFYSCLLLVLCCCAPPKTEPKPRFDWKAERQERIKLDFDKTEDQVKEYISRYIPDVTDEQMRRWEDSKALECMVIDGQKKYFRNAAPNLFRIDPEARTIKQAKDGYTPDVSEKVNEKHVPQVIKAVKKTGDTTVLPQRFRVKYTLTVKPNVVPEGETIRCWLPFPKSKERRQKDVKLIAVNDSAYILAPNFNHHGTLYMEKKALKDQPTVFSEEFEYTSYAEWFNLKPEDIRPLDSTVIYMDLRPKHPHVRYSPRLLQLAEEIAGDVDNPLLKARRYFMWINENFPWASAREYSTIENIPEYVLDNKHGDCGQVTMLFINLCICSGIPAHFQSGFMMHPGGWNLHDWAEIYFEGIGWVPVDQSFGIPAFARTDEERMFFLGGIDSWRMIVNNNFSVNLYPEKKFPRSETVDFQRGEVEWEGGNLYFDKWTYNMEIEYLSQESSQRM